MNKRIRTGMITTALVGGSLLGVTQLAGTVSAQTDDGVTVTAPAAVDEAPADAPTDGEGCDRPEGAVGPQGLRGGGDRGARAEETAALIGIDVAELRTALGEGQTLADIANANGVDPQTIIDAKVADKAERLATAVEEGRLTDAEAAEKLADATERITTRVNEGRPERQASDGAPVDATDGG